MCHISVGLDQELALPEVSFLFSALGPETWEGQQCQRVVLFWEDT